MFGRSLRKAVCVLGLLSLGACAFTRDEVNLNYAYRGPAIATLTQSQINSISEVRVDDRRPTEDPRLIINKRNAYGQTTGGYAAEKPLAEIIAGAVRDGFQRAAIRTDGGPNQPALRCQLIGVTDQVQMGFWSGNYSMQVTLKAELIEPATNRVLWNDTIFGRATKSEIQMITEENLRDVFGRTLDDLVRQLVESNGLRHRLVTKL